jgi:hypothetical protein
MTSPNDYDKAILLASARQVANQKKYQGKTIEEVLDMLMSEFDVIKNRSGRIAGFTRRRLDCMSYDITPQGVFQFTWNQVRCRYDRLDESCLVYHGWSKHSYNCAVQRNDAWWNFPLMY